MAGEGQDVGAEGGEDTNKTATNCSWESAMLFHKKEESAEALSLASEKGTSM